VGARRKRVNGKKQTLWNVAAVGYIATTGMNKNELKTAEKRFAIAG
jgi:hypothetical protein